MRTNQRRQWFLFRLTGAPSCAVFIIVASFAGVLITESAAAASKKHPAPKQSAAARRTNSASRKACAQGEGGKRRGRNDARMAKEVPCHPKGYINPKVAKNYQTAMHELRGKGIRPQVTSAWRSSQEQARLHRCSQDSRCRANHPGLYYALPPGNSLHEAGFAVDISGIAAGPRGRKQVTPRGRRIISVMRKNGFKWRYGLKDPAHFEADPTRKGYRSVKQAIHKSQTTCTVKLASAKRRPSRTQTLSASRRAMVAKPISRRVSVDKLRRRNS